MKALSSRDLFCIMLVVCIGFSLRVTGLEWGIPGNKAAINPFHPDEAWSMSVMKQIHPSSGDWMPEESYREGPLSKYFWFFTGWIAKEVGIIEKLPYEIESPDKHYGAFIYLSRLSIVVLDTFSVLFIYLALRLITSASLPALIGSLCLSLSPFEIIYSKYMRTHIFANFFLCLVILLFCLYSRRRTPGLARLLGVVVGLAGAARYPMITVGIIPLLGMIIENLYRLPEGEASLFKKLTAVIDCNVVLYLLYIPLAFAAAAYSFLSSPDEVLPHLFFMANYTSPSEFGLDTILNLSRVFDFITYLIPQGSQPFLWIFFYGATIFLIVRKTMYRYFLPVLAFAIIFLYAMAKGYLPQASFIRAVVPLFPCFAFFCGLAFAQMLIISERFKGIRWAVITFVVFILGTTFLYDFAYARAMTRDDARMQLRKYLVKVARNQTVRLGAADFPRNYFVSFPSLVNMKKTNVITSIVPDGWKGGGIDYLLLGALEPDDFPLLERRLKSFLDTGRYKLVKRFENPVSIGGYNFRSLENPHDLVYPFPILYLLKPID